MSRRTAAVAAALAAGGLVAGLAADSGRAQDPSRSVTITYLKGTESSVDAPPKGLRRGKASLGDQFFLSVAVRRDDGATGRLQATYTVGQKRIPLVGSRGTLSGAYRFPDGTIFIQAEGTFDDTDVDRGAIVGGTGAYAGARGTLDSDKTRDVLHLEP
jgi:hypothetical protein